MIRKHPVLLLKNPLGTILNLLIIYSQWWAGIYAKNKSIALIIISVKILLITSLPPALAIFYWNHFGTGSTQKRFRSLQLKLSDVKVALNIRDCRCCQRHVAESYASGSGIDCYGSSMQNECKRNSQRKTKVLSATRLGTKLICGQYDTYKSEEGVDPRSHTPTFVAGDLYIDNWRWKEFLFTS